jgi:hypothetical protein
MVAGEAVCLRRLADGNRALEVRFNRFIGNPRVTLPRLIEGWNERTAEAAEGRHVLAIQDTSEINFATTPGRRRGLGEIGKGNGRGVLLHPMLAVDAEHGGCLGLLSGSIKTREGRRTVSHDRRALDDKESQRWIATAQAAAPLLAGAAMVTVLGDRESDIYALYASGAEARFHVIARSMHDRKLSDDSGLYEVGDAMTVKDRRPLMLRDRGQRAERNVILELRFGPVDLRRPQTKSLRHLPPRLPLSYVDIREVDPLAGTTPLHWRLLTTHRVTTAEQAWRIAAWYKQRWLIEQFFRILKTQGLQLEDSQIATADRLLKIVAIAAKAAVVTLQLLQARDGSSGQPISLVFDANEIATLKALNHQYEARTKRLRNPYPPDSLAFAAWVIGRLGGWDGYPSSKPPGPITMKHGLEHFHLLAIGRSLKDVCMP